MLPEGFISSLAEIGLADLPEALMNEAPVTSVRLNPAKGVTASAWPGAEPVPWAKGGYYLPERPVFTLDPALHQGGYYVQEAASMFHTHVVSHLVSGVTSPLRLLDSCAAPGGKTLGASDALPEGSLTVANEYVPARAAVLRENVVKWGNPNMIVTRADTADLARARSKFDIIIADVPCSGEGMMRKDSDAVEQWSRGLVRECVERQEMILANLWPMLATGGYLIYSTCTFNRDENELMVARMVDEYGAESVEIPVDPAWGITPGIDTPHHCYRFIPGRTRGEGLFVSVLRKPGSEFGSVAATGADRREKSKGKAKQKPVAIPPEAASRLHRPELYTLFAADDRITAFPTAHMGVLADLKKQVDVIHEGVTLGTVKGRDLIPAHSLAMSAALAPTAFPRVELDTPAALDYLRGDTPALPDGTPRGFVLLTHGGRPLGFVKNIGNRANSLYPTPWRIRMNVKD